ncbi:hypothetical protein GCM10011575_35080 [Microlunatus endophyticus]|uniref:Uncharacterized protein n=1 Tax=Microlunatus endophyticus TaxID=1716077 RepID=A0A917W7D7_9ACTN|nr:hypothetical protein GCM10011575_35080 [Microlunatus endophyticus]
MGGYYATSANTDSRGDGHASVRTASEGFSQPWDGTATKSLAGEPNQPCWFRLTVRLELR